MGTYKKYLHLEGYIAQQSNFIDHGISISPEISFHLDQTILIYRILVCCLTNLASRPEVYDQDRVDIVDSVFCLGKSLELINSFLHLITQRHFPSPAYLLRSILNCAWFSSQVLINPKHPHGNDTRFRDEYMKKENSRISPFEIKDIDLKNIISRNGVRSITNIKIIDDLNGILHNSYWHTILFKKPTDRDPLPINFSPVQFQKKDEEFISNILRCLDLIRLAMELIRISFVANYLDKSPQRIYQLFNESNIIPSQKNHEDCQSLSSRLTSLDQLNLKEIAHIKTTG